MVTTFAAGAAFAAALTGPAAAPLQANLQVSHLRCEYRENPLTVDAAAPRLSWELQSSGRGQRQTAYEILVARTPAALEPGRADLWDSGRRHSADSVGVAYHGLALRSGQRCWWKVRVWDKTGQRGPDSPAAYWQMGLRKPSDWNAQWISANTPRDTRQNGNTLPPCPYLRRTFTLTKPVRSATIFAMARGLYELHLNGAKVGSAVLAPGWTDYRKHLEYQAYDVAPALRRGVNTVGAVLGDGWYCGYVGFAHRRNLYGTRPALRLQLNITYTDGTRQIVGTDTRWRGRIGPIVYSDLLQGENYDARAALPGWDTPHGGPAGWQPAILAADSAAPAQVSVTAALAAKVQNNALSVIAGNDLAGDPAYNTIKQLRVRYTLGGVPHTQTVREKDTLQIPGPGEAAGALVITQAVYGDLSAPANPPALLGMHGPPVRVMQQMPARRITQPAPGTYIVDIGQNMVGWARLKVRGAAGTRVRLRFGEVLNTSGTLYTANLRSARATDTYVCRGGGQAEVWEPRFTFHGFRYVEVTGYPGRPGLDAVAGCVVGSDTPRTGLFTCSSPPVNKLVQNIDWGQRGNFLSIPTDCPQRDERLGWMGDAQIFARTATYSRDVAAFYENWLVSVRDGQSPEGGFSDVSPRMVDFADGAPAWGDAGVIVPWTVYEAYGDKGVLADNWPGMARWMDYLTSANPSGLWENRRANDFGDWLSIAADTPKDVLATAYYAYDAQLMAQMARALGRTQAAGQYDALFARIKAAFDAAYVSPDGRVKGDTQTCYVLALHFGLLPEALRPLAAQHLADNIAARHNHLSTGFVGVGYLCPVLTDFGHNDAAYALLLNTTYPSWGYSIKEGATTIWERWDGYTAQKGFEDPGMNSFNHYSLGSVGQWLYEYAAGIDTDPAAPGFQRLWLHPHPGSGLSIVSARYHSVRGPISSRWQTKNGRFTWDVTVPANTTATAWIPARNAASVRESGRSLRAASGVSSLRTMPGGAVCRLQSGTYHFTSAL